MGSKYHCAIFRSIGVTVFELSPRAFSQSSSAALLLRPITPPAPLVNFFDLNLLFSGPKLNIEYFPGGWGWLAGLCEVKNMHLIRISRDTEHRIF